MAIYVIGDVHGCRKTLQALWKQLPFRKKKDELWLAGDLVNRGPDSRGVLRWAMRKEERLGDRFACVLGNHDLHFLALAHGKDQAKPKDTLKDLLTAKHCDRFVDWLLHRAVVHRRKELMMVHAGLLPAWSWAEVERRNAKITKILRSSRASKLLAEYARRASESGDTPYHSHLSGVKARAQDLLMFTRLRTCDEQGTASPFSGPPRRAPKGYLPWFEHRGKRDGPHYPAGADKSTAASKSLVFFGHWAALGLYLGKRHVGTDSGCAWGRRLTAVRWPDLRVFQQPTLDH